MRRDKIKYIKKATIIFGMSGMMLFALGGCGKDSTSSDDTSIEESDDAQSDDESDGDEETEVVSGTYIPENNKCQLTLPDGNWEIENEEYDTSISVLNSEDGTSHIEIAYMEGDDAQSALGETPTTKEQLEEQMSAAEVVPSVEAFENTTENGVQKTIYTLKYSDGDYPYMIQGYFVKDQQYFTVIAMTTQDDASTLKALQKAVSGFQILE